MMNTKNILRKVYARVLALYPPVYRQAYYDEMLEVFQMQLDATGRSGSWELLRLGLTELRDLLLALAAAG